MLIFTCTAEDLEFASASEQKDGRFHLEVEHDDGSTEHVADIELASLGSSLLLHLSSDGQPRDLFDFSWTSEAWSEARLAASVARWGSGPNDPAGIIEVNGEGWSWDPGSELCVPDTTELARRLAIAEESWETDDGYSGVYLLVPLEEAFIVMHDQDGDFACESVYLTAKPEEAKASFAKGYT